MVLWLASERACEPGGGTISRMANDPAWPRSRGPRDARSRAVAGGRRRGTELYQHHLGATVTAGWAAGLVDRACAAASVSWMSPAGPGWRLASLQNGGRAGATPGSNDVAMLGVARSLRPGAGARIGWVQGSLLQPALCRCEPRRGAVTARAAICPRPAGGAGPDTPGTDARRTARASASMARSSRTRRRSRWRKHSIATWGRARRSPSGPSMRSRTQRCCARWPMKLVSSGSRS